MFRAGRLQYLGNRWRNKTQQGRDYKKMSLFYDAKAINWKGERAWNVSDLKDLDLVNHIKMDGTSPERIQRLPAFAVNDP